MQGLGSGMQMGGGARGLGWWQVGAPSCRGAGARSSTSLGLGTGKPKENTADSLILGPDTVSGHRVQSLSMPCFREGNSEDQRWRRPYPRSHSNMEPSATPAPSPVIFVLCQVPIFNLTDSHFHQPRASSSETLAPCREGGMGRSQAWPSLQASPPRTGRRGWWGHDQACSGCLGFSTSPPQNKAQLMRANYKCSENGRGPLMAAG